MKGDSCKIIHSNCITNNMALFGDTIHREQNYKEKQRNDSHKNQDGVSLWMGCEGGVYGDF